MKTINIQTIALFILIILTVIFIDSWNSTVEVLATMLFIYWCIIVMAYLLFSYSSKKSNYTVNKDGKRVLKIPGGLKVHGVTFKEYLKFIYSSRLKKEKTAKPNIKGLEEQYLKSSLIKEIVLLIIAAGLFVSAALTWELSVYLKVILIVFGCPALLMFIDFIILRARYEDGLFKDVKGSSTLNI